MSGISGGGAKDATSLASLANWENLRDVLVGTYTAAQVTDGVTKWVAGGVSTTQASAAQQGWHFDPADIAVPGLTTKMRLKISGAVDAVAPAADLAIILNSYVNTGGGATNVSFAAPLVAAGSGVTILAPPASLPFHAESPEFNALATGFYVATMVASAAFVANSAVALRCTVQFKNIP